MYTNEDAARWAVPAASVRFNLNTRGITSSTGGGSSAPSLPFSVYHEATATAKDRDRDPRVIREQLKEITNRRVQSSDAFDTHASWYNKKLVDLVMSQLLLPYKHHQVTEERLLSIALSHVLLSDMPLTHPSEHPF